MLERESLPLYLSCQFTSLGLATCSGAFLRSCSKEYKSTYRPSVVKTNHSTLYIPLHVLCFSHFLYLSKCSAIDIWSYLSFLTVAWNLKGTCKEMTELKLEGWSQASCGSLGQVRECACLGRGDLHQFCAEEVCGIWEIVRRQAWKNGRHGVQARCQKSLGHLWSRIGGTNASNVLWEEFGLTHLAPEEGAIRDVSASSIWSQHC